MKTAVSEQNQKTAYQIKREKAGARCGVLSFMLLIVILAANVDNVFASETHSIKIVGLGFNLGSIQKNVVGNSEEIEFLELKSQTQFDIAQLKDSDIVVQEGIEDLGVFIEMVNTLEDTIVVVIGETPFGQGLMLDNMVVAHSFDAKETLSAILKMKLINPKLTHAQIMVGLYGEDDFESIARDEENSTNTVSVKSAEKFALASLKKDTEAPRLVSTNASGRKTIQAQFEDNEGVSYVEMYVDEQFVSRDYEAPYEFDINPYANRHVSLVAYDSSANFSRLDLK